MSGDEGNQGSRGEVDSLLRAIAAAPAREPAKTPERIAHFRILGLLGSGGMGIVYRAEDEKLRRTVALKVLPQAFAGDAERRRRFLREARSAAALTHGNIAIVYEVDEHDGQAFIAMELVEGETLRERIARGPLPPAEALRIARGIARGLVRAHARGIVHRDLKPENVVVEPDGEPKILDFGLAKLRETEATASKSVLADAETASPPTQEGQVLGTPQYMSPEQARGDAVDGRGDVFSLGIVLYEMLSGERPFGGRSIAEVLASVLRDEPRPLAQLAPGVPRELAAVVDRCLAKSPAARWPGARELLEALETVPTSASMKSQVGVGVEATAAPRRRSWAAGAAVLTAAAVGVAATLVVRSHLASPASSASAARAQDVNDAPAHGVAMTDYPAPRGASPEIAAAYASALQQWREAEMPYAIDGFASICKRDPAVASADLRLTLYGRNDPDVDSRMMRECYAAAVQHRDTLDERDRMFLQLAETRVADPPLPPEAEVERARAITERFPHDAEAFEVLGDALFHADRRDEGRKALRRALELDPKFAAALWALGNSYQGDDEDEARELLGRCIQISPSAGSCIRNRAMWNMHTGHCTELEDDARRLSVVEPDGPLSYEFLAVALAARNAPLESVAAALAKRVPLEPDDRRRRVAEIQNRAWLDAFAGDLAGAAAAAREWDDVYRDSLVSEDHQAPLRYLFDVLLEQGDAAKLADFGEAVDRRALGWTGGEPLDLEMRALYARYHAGRIEEATFEKERDALEHGKWLNVDETPECETTADEARWVLARSLATDGGPWAGNNPLFDAARAGHTYLLAGQPALALPHLRRGVASCAILPQSQTTRAYPVWWMRNHVDLGQALEQTGDTAGACAAYAVVLDRWKNAKPRSVSLEKARERSKALGCSR